MGAWELNETLPSLALGLLVERKAVLWGIWYTSVQEQHKQNPSQAFNESRAAPGLHLLRALLRAERGQDPRRPHTYLSSSRPCFSTILSNLKSLMGWSGAWITALPGCNSFPGVLAVLPEALGGVGRANMHRRSGQHLTVKNSTNSPHRLASISTASSRTLLC